MASESVFHCIGEVARFSTRQCVSKEALKVESISVVGDGTLVSIERDQTEVTYGSGYFSSL
jgi:hypothetical protein